MICLDNRRNKMLDKLKEQYTNLGAKLTMIFVSMALVNDKKAQKSLIKGLEKLKELNQDSEKDLEMLIQVHKDFMKKQEQKI